MWLLCVYLSIFNVILNECISCDDLLVKKIILSVEVVAKLSNYLFNYIYKNS